MERHVLAWEYSEEKLARQLWLLSQLKGIEPADLLRALADVVEVACETGEPRVAEPEAHIADALEMIGTLAVSGERGAVEIKDLALKMREVTSGG